jgi:hypothetical protein
MVLSLNYVVNSSLQLDVWDVMMMMMMMDSISEEGAHGYTDVHGYGYHNTPPTASCDSAKLDGESHACSACLCCVYAMLGISMFWYCS